MTNDLPLGTIDKYWEIVQDDIPVVVVDAKGALGHYIVQYIEDGDVEVWEVKRKLINIIKKENDNASD